MDSLDDLLIKRRRGLLQGTEEQRLHKAVRGSLEYELALLAGDVFEREGAARPGDRERLEQLARATERHWRGGSPARRRWPRTLRPLVTLPLFLAGAAAASYGAYRALGTDSTVATPASLAMAPAFAPVSSPAAPAPPLSAPTPSRPLEREPEMTARGAPEKMPAATLVPHTPAPMPRPDAPIARNAVRERRTPVPAPRALPPVAPPAGVSREPGAPTPSDSARALFRHANQLRQRDWSAAASVYRELIRRYPDSLEAGIAEMALGKWFLSQSRSGDALEWFRAHQRRPQSALAAEALWGEARALETVGSRRAALAPWQRLLELHPSSPYAEIARQRLGR
jgi:TolA-binding protein